MSIEISIPSSVSVEASRAGTGIVPVVPSPRGEPITVRAGTLADVPFIDGLQKIHTHMVGWMPTKQIEGKIALGHVIIAEVPHQGGKTPIGYCISQDQYSGRDDVGIVYQLNVMPMKQRHLIGASLLKAVFERAAYGCKLYCCWCAQDIQANYFWESCGFIPLAFRTGSRGKQRTHIFWQRRIRQDDVTTPYWFRSNTKAGAIREDRLVIPIPPGTHWRDFKPLLLPKSEPVPVVPKSLPPTRPPAPAIPVARKMAIVRSQSKHLGGLPPGKAAVMTSGGIRYIDRGDYVPEVVPETPKAKRPPRAPAAKHDPKDIAAARELRDRYLEEFNSGKYLPGSQGKYDVSRAIGESVTVEIAPMKLLSAA